jgi:hypothetical protein
VEFLSTGAEALWQCHTGVPADRAKLSKRLDDFCRAINRSAQ